MMTVNVGHFRATPLKTGFRRKLDPAEPAAAGAARWTVEPPEHVAAIASAIFQ